MTLFEGLSIMAYYLQLLVIGGGLWMMREAGLRRDRQLDDMSVSLREQSAGIRAVTEELREQSAGLREQSAGLRALLERSQQP